MVLCFRTGHQLGSWAGVTLSGQHVLALEVVKWVHLFCLDVCVKEKSWLTGFDRDPRTWKGFALFRTCWVRFPFVWTCLYDTMCLGEERLSKDHYNVQEVGKGSQRRRWGGFLGPDSCVLWCLTWPQPYSNLNQLTLHALELLIVVVLWESPRLSYNICFVAQTRCTQRL